MNNVTLLTTVSAASDRTSAAYDLMDLRSFCVAVVFTGSNVVGTLILQASYDNVTYFTVANSSVSVTSSTSQIYDVPQCGYRYVRAKWTATSGTGNMTVDIHVKDQILRMP